MAEVVFRELAGRDGRFAVRSAGTAPGRGGG